jgi:hypothetical protein
MNKNEAQAGLRVRVDSLGTRLGALVSPQYLANRREGAEGTIRGVVNDSGDLVWWVDHDTGEVAPYSIHELEPLPDQTPPEETDDDPPTRGNLWD